MPVLTKICGLSTPATLDAAIAGGASHVGFVFHDASPRNISLDRLRDLARLVPRGVSRVGVFVDPDRDLVSRAIDAGLDAVQLHQTTPSHAASIKALGSELWAAVAVRTRADLAIARDWQGLADRIVYDAKTPESGLPGGMGLRFDWSLLESFGHPLPWGLSGGLDAGNVTQAVRITRAPLVDVSSGVESAPGVKDVDKIAAFLKAARSL